MWLVTCRDCGSSHAVKAVPAPTCSTCGSRAVAVEELNGDRQREVWRRTVGPAVRASGRHARTLREGRAGSGRRSVPPPSPAELAQAPFLEDWAVMKAPWGEVVLVGRVSGHPELPGEGRAIHTSRLLGLDPELRWARTGSRYYRLGTPIPE